MSTATVITVVLAGSLLMADDTSRSGSSNPALAEFEANVRHYLKVRKEAAKSVPDLKTKSDATAVIAYGQALAAAIRKARPTAEVGGIITPSARKHFRSITMSEVRAPDGAPVKDTIKQGNPTAGKEGADVKLRVNGTYPKAAPKSSMPPSLLERFPKLPEELEYRFVGKTLILLDTAANLIVDYAPEVGPAL